MSVQINAAKIIRNMMQSVFEFIVCSTSFTLQQISVMSRIRREKKLKPFGIHNLEIR